MNTKIKKKIEKKFIKDFRAFATLVNLRLNNDAKNLVFKPQNI